MTPNPTHLDAPHTSHMYEHTYALDTMQMSRDTRTCADCGATINVSKSEKSMMDARGKVEFYESKKILFCSLLFCQNLSAES